MASTRILITGATGLLGSTLTSALKNDSREIITHGFLGDAQVRFDLTNPANTQIALEKVAPDVVINLAALTSVEKCQNDPHQAYLLNVRTTENLARWTAKSKNRFLIQISTDQVYDSQGDQKEEDIRLTNVYSFSKYTSELVALGAGGAVLRTNFFGRSRLPSRKSLSDWIIENLKNRTPISLFDDIFFSPLSLTTLSGMIGHVVDKKIGGRFNLGSHEGMSKCEFGMAIAETFDLQNETATRASSNFEVYRPKDMRMDSSLFEKTFGVQLPTLKEEILKLRSQYDSSTGS